MAVIANRRSVMTLFSRPTDIHSHRARLVLAEKNINIEIASVLGAELPEDLMDVMIGSGLYFNPSTETGVLFHMIGALSEFGKLGVVSIADSQEQADEFFIRTREVLDDATGGRRRSRRRDNLPQRHTVSPE